MDEASVTQELIEQFRFSGGAVDLREQPTALQPLYESKKHYRELIAKDQKRLSDLQRQLFVGGVQGLVIILQGLDASGKDGIIRHVVRAFNPQGCRVYSFGLPNAEEAAHDFLWRTMRFLPERGQISVFNRSHYEDVLVVKVRNLAPPKQVEQRYEQINAFEKLLAENGTRVLKLMLHISREEQGERLKERLEVPAKRWKFNPSDIEDRKLWDKYQDAYEAVMQRCSTPHAPWHVVPADSRTRRAAIAARLIRGELEAMNAAYPDPGYRLDQYEID
jgi:PPK2 family polyphosphate:nucleotide phosphotransferase